ncbi:MAG TPA: universal stress protein [Bacteroidia bacterium]|nr:universal stress protein [Bacteroidia bacterium]
MWKNERHPSDSTHNAITDMADILKHRPPFPFETIALAVSFSGHLEALISETRHLAHLFGARIVLIHCGKKTKQKEKELTGLLFKQNVDIRRLQIYWESGDACDTVLNVCKKEVVDLLIAGALEKENLFRYYTGSTSREISRRAKCSVMMLTEPSFDPHPFHKIVVNGHEHPKTSETIRTAYYVAEKSTAEQIIIADEVDFSRKIENAKSEKNLRKLVEAKQKIEFAEIERVKDVSKITEPVSFTISSRVINGKAGHAIGDFARKSKADLLIVNSPDHHLSLMDRIFVHDLEHLLGNLPCNLLIVHSRVW